jgi:hypothetical protein
MVSNEKLSMQIGAIVDLDKKFTDAVAPFIDVDDFRRKLDRTDREAPRLTPEVTNPRLSASKVPYFRVLQGSWPG